MSLIRISACLSLTTFYLFYVGGWSIAQQQPVANAVAGPAGGPGGQTIGNQGGSAQADFDSLIDLIQSTVAADTWMENGTGEGEISPFAINGVYADTSGTLRFSHPETKLSTIEAKLRVPNVSPARDVRQSSNLRFISLPRLEATISRLQKNHQPLSPEMLTLAGLQRIEYVLVSPETGDLIIAGPAGDWQIGRDGILCSTESGQAVVRLDDFLTLWRRKQTFKTPAFGCSIIPRQAALAKTQAYLQESKLKPLEPNQRKKWLEELRTTLGRQDIEFFGIAADSHVAKVLLVADYHMKLIGMGITESVEGVQDYLSTVELLADGNPPPISVLRWWFAMNYEPVEVSADRNVFQLRGQGVQVLSENEILAARGQRVHTGNSDKLNRRFATSFTVAFNRICDRYPIYSELRNVFDIAMVLGIIEQEGLIERVGWQPTLFADASTLRVPQHTVPKAVETVINHRVINRKHIVAGISGGVWIDGASSFKTKSNGEFSDSTTLKPMPILEAAEKVWWWD